MYRQNEVVLDWAGPTMPGALGREQRPREGRADVGLLQLQAEDRRQPPGATKSRKDPPLEPPKEHSPAHTLVLDLWLQNWERMSFCFKPRDTNVLGQ